MQSQIQETIILKENYNNDSNNDDDDYEDDEDNQYTFIRKKSSSMDNFLIDEKSDQECNFKNKLKKDEILQDNKEDQKKEIFNKKKIQQRLRLKSQLQFPNKSIVNHQIKKTTFGFLDKYEVFEKLGEGSSSIVRRCRQKGNQKDYAVKIMNFNGPDELFNKINEWHIQSTLHHKNIVKSHDFYIQKNENVVYLVMNRVQGKTIQEHLNQKIKFSENEARIIIKGIIKAINYIHNKNICHRDINNYNIFYDQISRSVIVIDFSISKIIPKEYSKLWTDVGTLFFKAPEMFGDNTPYDKQVDIWGAGVILYYLVTGQLPFYDPDKSVKNLINQIQYKQLSFDKGNQLSMSCIDIISQMLDKNPKTRITSKQLLEHSWLKMKSNNFDNYNLHNKQIPNQMKKQLLSPNNLKSSCDLYFNENNEQLFNLQKDLKFRHISIDDLNYL